MTDEPAAAPGDAQGDAGSSDRPGDHNDYDFDATRRVWRVKSRVASYTAWQGWIDAGERIGLSVLADEVRGEPVLDLGVGAGRTAWLIRLLTDDYVGLEWSPEMVLAAQAAYPGLDVRRGDARDLSSFPDETFKLVFFSFNGIDYNDHESRRQIMMEVSRVLRPDGILAYSTLSKEGSMYGERPWRDGSWRRSPSPIRAVAKSLLRLPLHLTEYPSRYANWWRVRRGAEDHPGWALAPAAHADFALVHFTTLPIERQLLGESGLAISNVFHCDGSQIDDETQAAPTWWYFLIARKQR